MRRYPETGGHAISLRLGPFSERGTVPRIVVPFVARVTCIGDDDAWAAPSGRGMCARARTRARVCVRARVYVCIRIHVRVRARASELAVSLRRAISVDRNGSFGKRSTCLSEAEGREAGEPTGTPAR